MKLDFNKAKESIAQSSMTLTYEHGILTDFEFEGSGVALTFVLADIMQTIISDNPDTAPCVGLACDYVNKNILHK